MGLRAKNFTLTCQQCDKEFQAGRGNAKTCSLECRWKFKEARYKLNGTREAQNRKFKTDNPNYSREYNLNKYYGITIAQYDEIMAAQNGGCAVCGKTEEQEGKSLAVDHDHGSGEIYGALCYRCNHGLIGRTRDPELYRKAAEYLSKGIGLFVPDQFKKGKRRRALRRKKT